MKSKVAKSKPKGGPKEQPSPAATAEQLVEADNKLARMNAMAKHQQGYSIERLAVLAGTSPHHVRKWLDAVRIRRSIY